MTAFAAIDLRVRIGTKRVLEGVSLSLERGKIAAVAGPNGVGKSTLLNCLAGLRDPDSGKITLDGVDLASIAPRRRAQRIGYLPQIPEIAWAVDVRTFVGIGRIPFIGARGLAEPDNVAVTAALRRTGTEEFADRIVNSLSGGERARVLLARALAGEPQWLLADEPFAGLDPGYQLDVADLFKELARSGIGVVVTVHDLQMAQRLADRVVMLHDGRILVDDVPGKALAPPILARAYGIEAHVREGVSGAVIEIVQRTPQIAPTP